MIPIGDQFPHQVHQVIHVLDIHPQSEVADPPAIGLSSLSAC